MNPPTPSKHFFESLVSWKPGDPLVGCPLDAVAHQRVDPEDLSSQATYYLLTDLIVPRPIAFVSTCSPEGISNLAPFSFFSGVSSQPPTLMIAISHKKGGGKKDTLVNLEKTGEFVVNGVDPWLTGPMNFCSADYPYGVDEMQKVGLTPIPSVKVRPFRVKESSIQIECTLEKLVLIGTGEEGSSTLAIGRVVSFHLAPQLYQEGRFQTSQYEAVYRLGGSWYGVTKPSFELSRPPRLS